MGGAAREENRRGTNPNPNRVTLTLTLTLMPKEAKP